MSLLHSIPKEVPDYGIPVEWQQAIAVLHREFPGIVIEKRGELGSYFTGIWYRWNSDTWNQFIGSDLTYRAVRANRYPDLIPFNPEMVTVLED